MDEDGFEGLNLNARRVDIKKILKANSISIALIIDIAVGL